MRFDAFDHLTLGVCYYPEHWPEALWEDDLVRMKKSGIKVVRIAEFAWSLFEPAEGVYSFDLFDRFLLLTVKHDMKVIFCTPTATPPAWLTEKYPEVLNAACDGTLYQSGLRRHYNYNSAIYQGLTEKIVSALGAHYGAHPQIIGWQLDNELNCETNEFHSKADHEAFRAYMKEKYETLDNLNDKMGTIVWSQRYSNWSELTLRRPTVNGQYNPHILFEEKQFFSLSAVRYAALQIGALRPYIGERFITTNGLFGNLDYQALMASSLDFLCFDSYPNFAMDMYQKPDASNDIKDRNWSRNLSETRALSPRFGIMEQQSGANGWTGLMEAPMPRPMQMRLWAMQSLAHGADFISFFRWRTAPCGTEIYWHGILDYDNRDNRRLGELCLIRDDIEKLQELAGSRYQSRVAVIRDYPNEWDAALDRWHGRVHDESLNGWFRACQHTHTPMDFLYLNESTPGDALAAYDLLVYPHATILDESAFHKLDAYVRSGGTLIFGARTGYKDGYGRCPMRPMAGYAGELCGARVKDYTFIGANDEAGVAVWDGQTLDAPIFSDILEPLSDDAKIEARFDSNYYKGEPAMISRAVGSGRAYYFGAAFSEATATVMLERLGFASPHQALILPSLSVELAVREKAGKRYYFLLNYMRTPQTVYLKAPMMDLLNSKAQSGALELAPFGVSVLTAI